MMQIETFAFTAWIKFSLPNRNLREHILTQPEMYSAFLWNLSIVLY